MYPDVVFLGLTLYEWCLLLGIIVALIVARVYADRLNVPAKLQNFTFIVAIFAIVLGLGSAVLFQATYDFFETGVFEIGKNTGATFYGGFLGGAAVFLIGYFLIGKKLFGDLPMRYCKQVTGFAACGVAAAHGIGRIGCFLAGCCYGAKTNAWYGIYLPAGDAKVVPTQLYEAIFLFLLFAVLSVLLLKTRVGCLGVYLSAYALFRFLIEFLRDDDRGSLVGNALSPSQFWAIALFLAGIALIAIPLFREIRKRKQK